MCCCPAAFSRGDCSSAHNPHHHALTTRPPTTKGLAFSQFPTSVYPNNHSHVIQRPSCLNESQYQAIPSSPTLPLSHTDYIQIHSLCLPETMASSAWHEADTQHLLNVGIGSQPCSSPPPPAAISYALKICWRILPGCQLPESCLTYFHRLLFHSRNPVIPSNIYL